MRTKQILKSLLLILIGFIVGYLTADFDAFKSGFSQGYKSDSKLSKEALNRTVHYNGYFRLRSKEDLNNFSKDKLREIEQKYQIANKDLGSEHAKNTLEELISNDDYKGANRIGCALLYLGQMSTDFEQEKYFLMAKNDYPNSWYGDGVNVGAYATYKLFMYYKYSGAFEKAAILKNELLEKYSDYIDHKGNLLSDIIM